MSDKQDAFVKGIAAEFPEVPHRYCQNHFLRDLAKPMLEADSHAKVQMRKKVRGLRAIEQEVLAQRRAEPQPAPPRRPVDGPRRRPPRRCRSGARPLAATTPGRWCWTTARGAWHPQRRPGRAAAPPGPAHGRGLARSPRVAAEEPGREKRGRAEEQLRRLAGCIDRGWQAVAEEQDDDSWARPGGEADRGDAWTRSAGPGPTRQEAVRAAAEASGGERRPGADADGGGDGGVRGGAVRGRGPGGVAGDNLDLERWFRLPKGTSGGSTGAGTRGCVWCKKGRR